MKIKWNQHPWMQLRLTMVSHERLSSTVGFYWCQYLNCTPDSRRLDLRPTGTHVVLQKLTDAWTTLSEGTTRTCRPSLGISEILLRRVWQRFSPSSSLCQTCHLALPSGRSVSQRAASQHRDDVLRAFGRRCSLFAHAPFDNRRHPSRPDDNVLLPDSICLLVWTLSCSVSTSSAIPRTSTLQPPHPLMDANRS